MFKVVHYSDITIYPVLKNSRDIILMFSSSILDIFLREIYKERENWTKSSIIRVFPWSNKSDRLAYLIVFFSILLFFAIHEYMRNLLIVFLSERRISFPLLSCEITQQVIKLIWKIFRADFIGICLADELKELHSFSLGKITTVFARLIANVLC